MPIWWLKEDVFATNEEIERALASYCLPEVCTLCWDGDINNCHCKAEQFWAIKQKLATNCWR